MPRPTFAAPPPSPAVIDAPSHITIEDLAPGVVAVTRNEPLGLANHANSIFIIGDSSVVVVDAQFTWAATEEVVAALKARTDKPVRYLVNTHWHDDHLFGNTVWRRHYPGVVIVSHEKTREDLSSIGAENRKGQLEGGPEAVTMFEDAMKNKVTMEGTPMSPAELDAYRSTVDIARQYIAEAPGNDPPLPDLVFRDRMTIYQGNRAIELRYFGEGITRGDAVVWLPAEKIAVTGDLFNVPFPFAYGCHPTAWIAALSGIRELGPAILVPGHGPVQRDLIALNRQAAALAAIREAAVTAVANGVTEEAFRQSVTLEDYRQPMTGENKMLGFLFRSYFAGPAAAAAFREVSAAR
ncbi:MAG TPA: MBL fold metallo-hydrolase [Candidatus Eisenbacteria bacterium]